VELPVDCQGLYAAAGAPGQVSIPTWKSELYFEYHRGVMTTQANHKRNMRDCRRRGAQRGEVVVARLARWRELSRAELTEDWKKVLFNQFHDLAAGSGIGVIYKDAQKDRQGYDVVRWSTNEIGRSLRRGIGRQGARPEHP
jgi:alpha-mannosidase